MAESWGGGSPTRCYFVYSTSATDATYSISISGYIYLPSSHSSSGGFPRYWSGWWGSGSRTDVFNLNMNGAGTTSLIASGGYNIGRAFGANGNAAFAISGSTYWGSADHSINFTVPARPYIIPRPPISPSVARISDNQATVSWTRDADASNQAQPWSGVYVERWSQSTGTWTRIATVTAADATSYSDAGIVSNNRYKYRVISYNATGSSSPVETSYIATTPTAPTAVSAEKQSDRSIVVTWTNTANYQSGSKILDNGSEVGTVGAGVSTWKHTTPNPAVPHIYRIVAVSDDRKSAESTPSNTVQLQAPPNAPTNVTPGIPTYSVIDENPGGVQPALFWKHNPVDSSVQRKYQIRMRKTGESVWKMLAENTTSRESSDLAEITTALDINWGYAAGQYELQVRTWGAYPNPGPYSATASFRLEHNPAVALLSPESAEVIDRSRITAEWSYSQAEARPQQQFTLTLRQSGDVVWERTVNGTALSHEIPYTLLDDVEYSLSLEVVASNGLSSGTQTVVFSVDYAEPALPGLIVEFSEGSGANNLSINNPSMPIETLINRVYRCIDPRSEWMDFDEGDPLPSIIDSEWELVGEFAPNTTISDYEGVTYGRTVYRVEAVSEIPSSKTNAISIDVWSTRVWLGAGDGYSTVASIPYDIEISDKDELAFQQEHYFDGIDLPTLVTGKAIDHEISVSGTLDPLREEGSTIDELRRVIRTPGNKVFRDHDGRRLYVSVSGGLKHDRRSRKIREVNVEMKEVTK